MCGWVVITGAICVIESERGRERERGESSKLYARPLGVVGGIDMQTDQLRDPSTYSDPS